MITDQIINYIKDQINRGVTREKIRTNLISAGWEDADITQAFSFAQPNGDPAVLKIAPNFAVTDTVKKESSIDKISLTKDDQPFVSELKKDTPVTNSFSANNNRPFRPADEPITTIETTVANSNLAHLNQDEINKTNNPTGLNQIKDQTQQTEKPKESILVVRNNKPNEIVRNFGDDGELKKPSASRALKNLALFLFLILLAGNGFLWFYVFPKMDTNLKNDVNNTIEENTNTQQQVREVVPTETTPVVDSKDINNLNTNNTSPIEALKNPTNSFKTYTANYFTKNNSYGTTPMLLSSCSAANTVFTDVNVKKTLDQISAISKGLPYCSLATDDTTKKNRMTSYLVYMPMDEAGYCIDSTGASLVVTKKPTGTSCVTAL